MAIFRTLRRKALWIAPLVVALLVIGCAGIEPYEPRNDREEGPERGLFTGSEGEFVIFRKADEPEADREVDKSSAETADGEQQKNEPREKEGKEQER
jgi:hypothetical protein